MDFLTATYKGIQGITHFDSGKPGPHVCLSTLTHGNEPVGIDIFYELVKKYEIHRNLRKGSLSLLVTCPETYNLYLRDKDPTKHRFQQHNMNRIANISFDIFSYECKRYKELLTFLNTVDGILDIHSTAINDVVMGIADISLAYFANRICDVPIMLLDSDMAKSGAFISSLVARNIPAIGIEAGQHTSPYACKRGINISLSFLKELGLLNEGFYLHKKKYLNQKQYIFGPEIIPLTNKFTRTISLNKLFIPIKVGEIYAYDFDQNNNKVSYSNETNKVIYIGLYNDKITAPDGCGFIFHQASPPRLQSKKFVE